MKCFTCEEAILSTDATVCPYCGSRTVVSDEVFTKSEKAKTKVSMPGLSKRKRNLKNKKKKAKFNSKK